MKVLIVDDSVAMRMIVKRTLRQAGFTGLEIEMAVDGQQGLDKAKAFEPDLILSDWNMPNKTGIEFLQELRAGGMKTPFAFVTSEGTPAMRALGRKEGAMLTITKPFTAETFRAALEPILTGGVE